MEHSEKLKIVKSLFWDYKVDPEEAINALNGKTDHIGNLHRNELFIKLLNFYPWHTIRKLVPESLHKELLSDEVIQGLFPPILRDRYRYVRKLL